MPQLTFTISVPARAKVTLLLVEDSSLDQFELDKLSTGKNPDVLTDTINFTAATRELVIYVKAEGDPNIAVSINFTTPGGKKIYTVDKELIIDANRTGVFLDKKAKLPKP